LNRSLKNVSASDLGSNVISSLLKDSKIKCEEIDEVIMGQVLAGGAGQNPARQAALKSGIPIEKPAYIVNQVCGSGIRSVASAFQSINNGDSSKVIAGGQENMSLAPHCIHLRDGKKLGDTELIDTMIKDGLWDAFNGYHMGVTAENVAEKFQITRDEQDKFAFESQEKALNAQNTNKFKQEIIDQKVKSKKTDINFNKDEHPREGINLETLSRLKPVFKKDGTVTAGNASGINDGAAGVMMMTSDEADKKNLKKLVSIKSWASCGVDPALMGTGPIPSSRKALDLAGWNVEDIDLFEINEAFAAQSLAVLKTLSIPQEKVNVNGGAIALGHPIGASGTRILVTLIHEMIKRDVKKGLATLCIGGGMGIAMCVER
jgi:acetyl-CoA C-acetyltransferase